MPPLPIIWIFVRSLTAYMRLQKGRDLVQNQLRHVNLPQPLFESTRTMRNHLQQLVDENLIGRDLRVPRVDKLPDDDRNQSIQLIIHVVRARERRQELLQRRRAARLGT